MISKHKPLCALVWCYRNSNATLSSQCVKLVGNVGTDCSLNAIAIGYDNGSVNDTPSRHSQRSWISVTRVLRCVISVVGIFGGFVALPLAVRDLIEMVVEGIVWIYPLLPL